MKCIKLCLSLCLLFLASISYARNLIPLYVDIPQSINVKSDITPRNVVDIPEEWNQHFILIDGLLGSNNCVQANAQIIGLFQDNITDITYEITEQLFSQVRIAECEDPLAALISLKTLVMTSNRLDLMPIVKSVEFRYGLIHIDSLIATGKFNESNDLILEWLDDNIELINLEMGIALFSKFDLLADGDIMKTFWMVVNVVNKFTPEQKIELGPVLTQIKTKYELMNDDVDTSVFEDIPSIYIPIVRVPVTQIPIHVVNGVKVAYLQVEHLLMDLTSIGPGIIKIVRIDGVDIPVTIVGHLIMIDITFNSVNIDWDNIPSNVIVFSRFDTSTLDHILVYKEKYNETLLLMGEYGLVVPHSLSVMGMEWKRLKKLTENPDWIYNPETVMAWDIYWREMKMQLDRISKMKNRRR